MMESLTQQVYDEAKRIVDEVNKNSFQLPRKVLPSYETQIETPSISRIS
jgi:hypothetical protein